MKSWVFTSYIIYYFGRITDDDDTYHHQFARVFEAARVFFLFFSKWSILEVYRWAVHFWKLRMPQNCTSRLWRDTSRGLQSTVAGRNILFKAIYIYIYFLIKICSQDLFQWGVLVGYFSCLWQHGCIFFAFVELRDMLGSQDATLLVKILQNLAVLISKPYPLHVAAMVMPGSSRHRRKNTQAATSPAPTISPQKSTEEAEQNRSRVRKLQIHGNFKTLKWRYCTKKRPHFVGIFPYIVT